LAAHPAGPLTRAQRIAVVRDAAPLWAQSDPAIRPATVDDEPALVELLSTAFARDPVARWITGPHDADGRRRRALFRMCLQLHDLRAGEVLTTADRTGVVLWNLSECNAIGLLARATQVRNFLGFAAPGRIPQLLRFFAALESRRPAQPHVYAQFIGTLPSQRRVGLGGLLLRCVADVADRLGRPLYAEASRPLNVEIWGRCGLAERGALDLAPGAPRMWQLWRPAQRPPAHGDDGRYALP
jgi:GNAT superfamily N-acetyltransferase